jgi:aldehyde:ferredoxin oxidoreductase
MDAQPSDVLNTEKVRYALYTEILYSCLDSINLCQFVYGPAWHLFGPSQMVDAVRAITGWNASLWELMKVGERRLNLMRAFNAREGLGRDDDTLPKKLTQALVGGASDGIYVTEEEVEQAKDIYYAMAGWDVASGTPKRPKLEELGLKWAADELGLP